MKYYTKLLYQSFYPCYSLVNVDEWLSDVSHFHLVDFALQKINTNKLSKIRQICLRAILVVANVRTASPPIFVHWVEVTGYSFPTE